MCGYNFERLQGKYKQKEKETYGNIIFHILKFEINKQKNSNDLLTK